MYNIAIEFIRSTFAGLLASAIIYSEIEGSYWFVTGPHTMPNPDTNDPGRHFLRVCVPLETEIQLFAVHELPPYYDCPKELLNDSRLVWGYRSSQWRERYENVTNLLTQE